MKKRQMPAWAACLFLLALTVYLSRFMWLPITEDSGETSTQVLKQVDANRTHIILDFMSSTEYRLPRNDTTEALLTDAEIGQAYEVTARYHSSRNHRNRYYEILALSTADGTVYRTIEESEANRQAALPSRITYLIVLDVTCCALLIWREQRTRKRNTKEANT